jgi:hypothetical protein
MRFLFKPHYGRAYKKLTAAQQADVKEAIARLSLLIGQPHAPSGSGIRPFGKFRECRAGLHLRILFDIHGSDIILETVGTHRQIANFIKNR